MIKVDRKPLYYGNRLTNEQRDANVQAMAEGVKGIHCTLVAKITASSTDDAYSLLYPGERFNSVECYENGALNLFVHDNHDNLNAVVRIRPTSEEVPNA